MRLVTYTRNTPPIHVRRDRNPKRDWPVKLVVTDVGTLTTSGLGVPLLRIIRRRGGPYTPRTAGVPPFGGFVCLRQTLPVL